MDAKRQRDKKLQTNRCDSYTQSSPNSIKHVTLLRSLSLYVYLVFSLPSVVDRDSKVWKGGEQNCVCVCEGGEV